MIKSNRIISLDVVRIFSCLCVLICHFNAAVCGWENGLKFPENAVIPSFYFENRLYIGDIGVSLFFILSGATLYLTFKSGNVRQFYKKRFLAIYPIFWIAWLVTSAIDFLNFKTFGNGNILYMLSTAMGMDGYLFIHGITGALSFYKTGEWFLGCILLLYLIFPLLHWFFEKHPRVTFLVTSVVALLFANGYQIGQYQINSVSFFVRIPELLIGMWFVKRDMRHQIKKFLIFSGAAAWLVILTRQWIHFMILRVVICMCLFALLVFIGEQITSSRLKRECVQLGALTFPIFLVHHWLIDRMVIGFQLEGMPRRNVYFMFTIYILLSIMLSQLLNYGKTKLLERIRFAS